MEALQLNDLHPSNWASVSTTKKELTEAVGDHWMGKKTKKKNSPKLIQVWK
jgi:hypothetical protein